MRHTARSFQELGYERRMKSIFKNDGKTLVVGLDHGTSMGVLPGLEDLSNIPSEYIESGVDGLLLGPKASMWAFSSLSHYANSSYWIRLNRTNVFDSVEPEKWAVSMIAEVEDAIRVNADAAVIWYIRDVAGGQTFSNYEEQVAQIAVKCRDLGLPLVVEALTIGNKTEDELINTARIAYELGADILKINYPGSKETLQKILNSVDIPVLLAGGAGESDSKCFLDLMSHSIKMGVRGVIIGRNIWQAKNPLGVIESLKKIIHE